VDSPARYLRTFCRKFISPVNPSRIIAGRTLRRDHYEIVVSDKTGFKLNDYIRLGRHRFKVVGITHGTVASGGSPLVYMSLKDAQELQFLFSNNRIRNDRLRGIVSRNSHLVNAIVATIRKGYSPTKCYQNRFQTNRHVYGYLSCGFYYYYISYHIHYDFRKDERDSYNETYRYPKQYDS